MGPMIDTKKPEVCEAQASPRKPCNGGHYVGAGRSIRVEEKATCLFSASITIRPVPHRVR